LIALNHAPQWRPSSIERAVQYIKRHQDRESGGFSTYSLEDRIDAYIAVRHAGYTRGWLDSRTCVTAAALLALRRYGEPVDSVVIQRALNYLRSEKNTEGVWDSYWWNGSAYTTYIAIRALAECWSLSESDKEIARKQLDAQQLDDGGWGSRGGSNAEPFETAFGVLTYYYLSGSKAWGRSPEAIRYLLDSQDQDGSWNSFPILRIPPPTVRDEDDWDEWQVDGLGTGVIIRDGNRIFTTAAVAWALAVHRASVSACRCQ
jgi:squalene cyclase